MKRAWLLVLGVLGCDDGGGGSAAIDAAVPDAAVPDAAVPDAAAPPEEPCGRTAESLRDCVDLERYTLELNGLAGAREDGGPHWQQVQDRCADELSRLGFRVERHDYGTGVNVIGVLPGTSRPDEHVLVSAHYDSVLDCDGADDNASGVAGALEAARVLATQRYARSLVVACWDEEEKGLIGSRAFARRAKQHDMNIVANYVLEMIAYSTSEADAQRIPAGLDLIFPEPYQIIVDREFRGDFIVLAGDDINAAASADMVVHGDAVGLPVVRLILEEAFRSSPAFGDLRRSDHAPFWDLGYTGIMITDTSEFRNPNYHCAWAEDSVDSVDPAFAAKVVQAMVGSAATQLEVTPGAPAGMGGGVPAGDPPLAPACTADSCGAGMKCAPLAPAMGDGPLVEACVDAGDGAARDMCTRTGNRVGIDTCGPGLFCALYGMPAAAPQTRQCFPMCNAAADCAAGAWCLSVTEVTGVCVPRCDPFADGCGPGQRCQGFLVLGGGEDLTCSFAGPRAEGDMCDGDRNRCGDGLECTRIANTLAPQCRRWCDPDHACPAGRTCVRDTSYGTQPRGFCADPAEKSN